ECRGMRPRGQLVGAVWASGHAVDVTEWSGGIIADREAVCKQKRRRLAAGNWDSHGNMAEHVPLARNVDRPIAGLIKDLKSRGMLADTLVVWATEFGRTPYHEQANRAGREHHHQVFSSWLAGGGV